MKDDLRQINKEEDRLQRELLQIHKKNMTKHDQVVSKNNIDTSIQNTEQLLRKLVNAPADLKQSSNLPPKSRPSQPGKEDDPLEEQIEESLENLDHLLEGLKKGTKEQEIAKLGQKFNIPGMEGQAIKGKDGYGKKSQNAFEYEQPGDSKKHIDKPSQ